MAEINGAPSPTLAEGPARRMETSVEPGAGKKISRPAPASSVAYKLALCGPAARAGLVNPTFLLIIGGM